MPVYDFGHSAPVWLRLAWLSLACLRVIQQNSGNSQLSSNSKTSGNFVCLTESELIELISSGHELAPTPRSNDPHFGYPQDTIRQPSGWNIMRPSEILWSHMRSLEIAWDLLKPHEAFWDLLKPYEAFWDLSWTLRTAERCPNSGAFIIFLLFKWLQMVSNCFQTFPPNGHQKPSGCEVSLSAGGERSVWKSYPASASSAKERERERESWSWSGQIKVSMRSDHFISANFGMHLERVKPVGSFSISYSFLTVPPFHSPIF